MITKILYFLILIQFPYTTCKILVYSIPLQYKWYIMKKIIQLLVFGCVAGALGQTKTSKPMDTLSMEKIQETRTFFNSLGLLYPEAKDISISTERIAGILCWWFRPREARDGQVILYAHGGSYALGGIESHRAMVSHLAASVRSTILFVDYSLAPEKPFPQGREDFLEVYSALCEAYPGVTVYMMGDSAGGGLIVSALGALLPELPQPAGVVLLSPWIDLECRGESYSTNSKSDPILSRSELLAYSTIYCPERETNFCTPARIEFDVFPPCLLMVGSGEILADDSAAFYSKIRKIQSNTRLSYFEGVTHVWPLSAIDSPPTKECWNEIQNFLESIR